MGDPLNKNSYQDPDYENIRKSSKANILSEDFKIEKTSNVISKEFSSEIQKKENEIDTIDKRLLLAKKTLHRLRYAIVSNYYNCKQFQLNDEDVHKEIVSQKDPIARTKVHALLKDEQKRIHPALKKILGTKPDVNLDELFKIRPPRKRNKADDAGPSTSNNMTIAVDDTIETLRSNIKCEIKTEPCIDKNDVESEPSNIKIPRYIEPKDMDKNVLKIDTAIRNKQKEKFRIIIGNTSKYTPPHSEMDRSTHRWLLYIRGPRDRPDISHFVDHVVVKLDSSYAPHNIVKLKSTPFHLSRRGWGEFAVNLRVYFRNERLNKPINLVHNLKLDRNYTGLQTLGSETVVDVWLYCDETMLEKESNRSDIDKIEDIDNSKHKNDDTNLLIVKQEVETNPEISQLKNVSNESVTFLQKGNETCYDVNNIVIKIEPDEESTDERRINNISERSNKINSMQQNKVLDVRINQGSKNINSNSLLKSSFLLKGQKSPNQKCRSLVKTHPNSLLKIDNLPATENTWDSLQKRHSNELVCNKYPVNIEAVLTDHCYVSEVNMLSSFLNYNSTINKMNATNISPVLATKLMTNSSKVECYENNAKESVTTIINFFNISIRKMSTVRSAVNIMLKKMPIIHEMADTEEYQRIFPYAVKTEEEYFKLHFIKRRNIEWTRAKIIKNFLRSHWMSEYPIKKMWSVKQIILFSHCHGYYPVKKNIKLNNHSDENKYVDNFNGKLLNSAMFRDNGNLYDGFDNVHQINSLTNINDYKMEINIEKYIKCKEDIVSNNYVNLSNVKYESGVDCSIESSDDEIDVCNTCHQIDDKKKSNANLDKIFTNEHTVLPFANDEKLMCSYIERICAKQGIELRNEDVGNGCSDSLVHKTILSSIKSLIEDILRRSIAVKMTGRDCSQNNGNKSFITPKRLLWESSESGAPCDVNLRHVYEAINTRSELDLLTNNSLGTLEMEYEEEL